MPSVYDTLPYTFSRNISQFGFRLLNSISVDPQLNEQQRNVVLSTLHIHSNLTLLLFGSSGRSSVEFLSVIFPEWCTYEVALNNYNRLLYLLKFATTDIMNTSSYITFNLHKNLAKEFYKIGTDYFYTNLIELQRNQYLFQIRQQYEQQQGSQPLIPSGSASGSAFAYASSSSSAITNRRSNNANNVPDFMKINSNNNPSNRNSNNNNNDNGNHDDDANNSRCSIDVFVETKFDLKFSTELCNKMQLINDTFYANPNSEYEIEMLKFNGTFKYAVIPPLRSEVIEIPLNGDNSFSLLVFRPLYRWGLYSLQNSITSDYFRDLHHQMKITDNVNVQLPKFRIHNSRYDLNRSLRQTGLETVFRYGIDLNNAFDLTSELNRNQQQMPIDFRLSDFSVTQSVNIKFDLSNKKYNNEVKNNKTENKIKKNNIDNCNNCKLNLNRQYDFIVNYPFLFVIRWNVYNIPLYLGTINSPNN